MSSKPKGTSLLVQALQETKGRGDTSSGSLKDLPIMEDGDTAESLALQARVGVKTIRERLKGLLAEGRLLVGRKKTKDLMGRDTWVPVYKMTE